MASGEGSHRPQPAIPRTPDELEAFLRRACDPNDSFGIYGNILRERAVHRRTRYLSPDDDLDDVPSLPESQNLLDDEGSIISDLHGCALPGTPEEDHMLEDHDEVKSSISGVLHSELFDDADLDNTLAAKAAEQAEQLVRRVWEASWKVTHFHSLPKWLQDNDYLMRYHRPPLHSFYACFTSIFRLHTETGNIWTHLLGCIAFIGVTAYFLTRPYVEIQLQEKIVFSFFFFGAILCLGFSFAFHTVSCHSEQIGHLFSKLDYCGIALLIFGSFVPWVYYGFYCEFHHKVIYLSITLVLGILSVVTSFWEKFGHPKYRPLRAGVFMSFGLSGVVPGIHYVIAEGFLRAFYEASFGWLLLMGILYIIGAMLYALRVPERFFPGKCDLWFQSHQLFHLFVVAAAFVHYHGITELAAYRLTYGDCALQSVKPAALLGTFA